MRITIIMYLVKIDRIPAILKGKKAIHLNETEQFITELKGRVSKGKR